MKFKVKSKSKLASLEDKMKKMEKQNAELTVELNKAIYRSEEDTIRKLIKIEGEVKNKMNTSSVYDHVQYESDNIK